MKTTIAIITVGVIFCSLAVMAQNTNAPAATAPISQPSAPIPANIKADLVKLFVDCIDQINLSGLTSAGFIAWVSARLLRKGVPDSMQTGIVGTVLKHAALEINPEPAAKPQPAADAAQPK
jgi:hypothetical protein